MNNHLIYLNFKGQGKLVMKDGSYFEGEFKDGEMGKGVKYDAKSGATLTGIFVDGQLQGKGTVKVKNGIYEGELHEGSRHGYGELKESIPNRCYKGQWYMNKRHGKIERKIYI